MARILVVEDNPLNMKLVTVILRRAGHDVATAADAEEAGRQLEHGSPDLILMDLGLPGKDGYVFTRELRERTPTKDLPIVAVTAYAMKGDWERARDAGCNDYVTKPIDGPHLVERVQHWLDVADSARSGSAGVRTQRVTSRASGA